MDAEDPGNEFPRSEGERDQHQRPEKETKSGEAGWGRDSFKLWTNQPMFKVAKLSFNLTLGLGLILTIWLHLPYLPAVQKLPIVGLVGTILSFCEVTFIFFTLMLFPINIWIFEVERNVSIPIGWSYFIGWLVLILYVSCAILCYFNYKSFWSLILSHPSSTVSCSSSFASAEESPRAQMITDTPITQEGVLDPERKDTHL
ncbi:outer dense fiber protein 4 isoform X7 [Macaca thibetana thibetana]|uniref:outer dense fiber protein 4 isoform X7 n=1 Tax=Macaca thibetana thibetana TaxID=257877 RepID=UPI0021BC740D|nr:outer dense fiber protein 4 isoform X7 [Macaca thibetana thibetana]